MIDCTHQNVQTVYKDFGANKAIVIAGYDTGSASVDWTTPDWNLFRGHTLVTIDQGFTGSPVSGAIVRDVERGAWTPRQAVDKTNWHPARPTIYCDRNDLNTVIADGWRGDVWLAYPGWLNPFPPNYPQVNIVAVQDTSNAAYDKSIVYDTSWPALPLTFTELIVQELPTIQKGATGEPVRTAQSLCVARHHTIAIDGVFGTATESAVKAIQNGAHITADGIVGPQTWPVLMGV